MKTKQWMGFGAALGAAAGLGSAYWQFRQDLRAREHALSLAARTAYTSMGHIEYGREGTGQPALVIHGAGGGFDQGLSVGQELMGPDYDIIAPSRFGFLGTLIPDDASVEAQADAHAALLDTLEIKKAVITGISAGAPSAIAFALRHPKRVTALILIVPRAFDPENQVGPTDTIGNKSLLKMMQGSADFLFWSATRTARSRLIRFVGVDPALVAKATPEDQRKVSQLIDDILPLSARSVGMRNDAALNLTEPDYQHIKAPTLVISANDDLLHTLPGARHAAERIPDAALIVFPTGGHVLVGRGGEVRAEIRRFVARRNGDEPKTRLAPDR